MAPGVVTDGTGMEELAGGDTPVRTLSLGFGPRPVFSNKLLSVLPHFGSEIFSPG